MEYTFEASGKWWKTDKQTIDLLRDYRAKDDQYMVSVVFSLAKEFGRVISVKCPACGGESDKPQLVLGFPCPRKSAHK